MPDETILCPSCKRKVRVPLEQMGQVVLCPLCNQVFVAPNREGAASSPGVATPAGEPAAPGTRPPDLFPRPNLPPTELRPTARPGDSSSVVELPAAINALKLPGIALLVLSTLGLMLCLYQLRKTLADGPEGVAQQLAELTDQMVKIFPGFKGAAPPPEMLYSSMLITTGVFLLLHGFTLIGAIQMLRLRMYSLAVLGSFLAMLNCSNCFCLFSLPFGIWALILLNKPEVKDAFS